MANDINEYLIEFWKAIDSGFIPPEHISFEEYIKIKEDKGNNKVLTLWAGICCSYGGKWFGGFIDDYKEDRRLKNGRLPNHQKESRNGVIKQIDKLKGVVFTNLNYWEMNIPENSIIYCDPPYEGTTEYKNNFDHVFFWNWVRKMVELDHKVFVSEYNAPEDFVCVKEIKINTQLGNGSNSGSMDKIEKLFVHRSQLTN